MLFMPKRIISNPNKFKDMIGEFLGYSEWKKVTQKEIDNFANATEDYQWIHLDKKRAKKESPYRETIAHGYYSLSLLPKFIYEVWECSKIKLILNYGTEKVRFISPVVCNNYIRAAIFVIDAKDYKNGLLLKCKVNIEIKDNPKLALFAETLSLLYY